ncbi:MAG: oligosaccharide flippase family protein [Candidatus Thermoplasmatota archaeon]|nr:oligosaccharide flippase family protein [Candidatus Thermoplasmatota archaeon]MCL5437828.1 oligosaccharide flippase family protein [Candidatus Thermoplasmatota archaeon]
MFSSKSPILIAQNAINAAAGLVGIYMLARFFPVSWGMLAFGMGFVGLFTLVGDLGFSTAYIKNASAKEDLPSLNSTFLLIKLALSSVFVVITLLSVLVWVILLGHGFQYREELYVIVGLIPYYFFTNMISFTQAHFTSKFSSARMSLPAIAEALLRNGLIVIIVSLYLFGKLQIGTYEMALILPIIYGITFTLFFALSYNLGKPWKFSRPNFTLFKKMVSIALPLTFASSMGVVKTNLDKVLIQYYWHTIATGAFYLNQRLISFLMNISAAISVFFIPLLVRATGKEKGSIGESIRKYERVIFLFISPFVVAFVFLGQFLLNLFGGFYKPYALLLPILSLNVLFWNSSLVFSAALISRDRAKLVGMVNVVSILLNIGLDLILIPQEIFGFSGISLGVIGAGVGTLASSIFSNVVYRLMFRKEGGVAIGARVPRVVVPILVEAVFDYIVLAFVQPYPAYILLPLLVASIALFVAVAIAVRELSFEELREILGNFNPLKFPDQLSKEREN